MTVTARKSLQEYLALEYPFNVLADPDGGYVIVFPDLPGCMTQVESLGEVGPMAEEIRALWIESEYEDGEDIPLPSYPEEYSGKFNLRLPRSLHRGLAEAAARDGVSLNSYVAEVLGRGDVQGQVMRQLARIEAQMEGRLGEIEAQLEMLHESLRYRPIGVPKPSPRGEKFQVVQEGYEDSVAA